MSNFIDVFWPALGGPDCGGHRRDLTLTVSSAQYEFSTYSISSTHFWEYSVRNWIRYPQDVMSNFMNALGASRWALSNAAQRVSLRCLVSEIIWGRASKNAPLSQWRLAEDPAKRGWSIYEWKYNLASSCIGELNGHIIKNTATLSKRHRPSATTTKPVLCTGCPEIDCVLII